MPIDVNGAELSFILDSGANKPILFNISDQDSVQINNVSEITIRGLGNGMPIKALKSKENQFRIGKVENKDQELYVVLDKSINLSPSLGMPIHGIIGYDLFRDFVVEINYINKVIKLHDPKFYRHKDNRKIRSLPLAIEKNKAYVDGGIFLGKGKNVPVRLLVDTGSSDAVWLFENQKKGLDVPHNNYDDFLGRGLSGDIYGKRTKVHSFSIGSFILNDAKAAFPDMESFGTINNMGNRNGSVGGEVLKRFNVVFDYSRKKVTFRKNGNFKEPFQYNWAGIELQHDGVRYIAESIADARGVVIEDDRNSFGNVQILMENKTRLSLVPEIVVSSIRLGSPAAEAGLREGDLILAINGKRIHKYKLQEVMKMLNEKEGKKVKVLIERYNSDLLFTFVLKKLF
ncbi:putative aspartyl protease [Saonia flava]|uniref:Putative aspartyl protease n=1 Tax=Saonia flava TaxID=523696 RepID=A0A846QRJ9_9FLAO|nr:aspartyl protease family protein [Saonia flava]NJB70718.1 putative aspartyl protease [Saonia flava]